MSSNIRKDVPDLLTGLNKKIIDLFGLYEYKPSPRADKSFLGIHDIDLNKYFMSNYSYRQRLVGFNPNDGSNFAEYVVSEKDYWKIKYIILKFMKLPEWNEYFEEELGSDWKKWAFRIKYTDR